MKRSYRRLSVILALAVLLCPLLSCADNTPSGGNGDWDGLDEWDGTRATTPDNLPEDLNFNGDTVTVLYREHLKEYEAECEENEE